MNKIKVREHEKDELSHYSSATFDMDYLYPFGSQEVAGNANRGQYDLTQHEKESKQKMEIYDDKTNSISLNAKGEMGGVPWAVNDFNSFNYLTSGGELTYDIPDLASKTVETARKLVTDKQGKLLPGVAKEQVTKRIYQDVVKSCKEHREHIAARVKLTPQEWVEREAKEGRFQGIYK